MMRPGEPPTEEAVEGLFNRLFFDPEDIHVMRLNESQKDFDARIEKYEGDENED